MISPNENEGASSDRENRIAPPMAMVVDLPTAITIVVRLSVEKFIGRPFSEDLFAELCAAVEAGLWEAFPSQMERMPPGLLEEALNVLRIPNGRPFTE